jgi:hypothetical protein
MNADGDEQPNYDGANVQVSTDNGATWRLVGGYNNPYNHNNLGTLSWTGSTVGWHGALGDPPRTVNFHFI